MTNAPASPARMRNTVAITSQNIEPVVKISMQRQNTSTNDGNRKRGKKSEANCHSAITTTNGKADIQTLFAIASITLDAEGGDAIGCAISVISHPHGLLPATDPPAGRLSTCRPHRPS
jgi:hypothetical protein